MSKDQKVLYITSSLLFAALLALLLVDVGISSKLTAAALLVPAAPAVWFLIRRRTSTSIHKREALLLVTVISIIYAIVLQMTGVHFGFYKNPYFVNTERLLEIVLPMAAVMIAVEIIRFVFLSQKNPFASVLSFLIAVLAEVLLFSSIPGITSFNKFMDLVGMTLFPALAANVFYHYASRHFGMMPNIAFRLITTLYTYFLPTTAAIPDALSACIKIVFPIGMFAFVSSLYEKKKKNALQKGQKVGWFATALTLVVIISIAMLISCQFRYGALVIATESMTGEINKGDMIIYERYDDQPIKEGQVIVFLQHKSKIVHRVIKIENIGGEMRYYTQGDANDSPDSGYRTEADIFGLTDMKVAYVGYPTLWLREMISK